MPQHPVVPRDFYELRLWQIWSGILHRDATEIGMKDDFFVLGGNRTRAEAVLSVIATRFDVPLSMETFLKEPTIERIACHLRARSRKLNEEPVVPLQPHGSKRPFFFLPSGEGNVFNFHALARRMAPDQPVYGLQTRGLHGEPPPFDRVEDMAADHIQSMRAVQPRGPYLLGGHCIGAMVALEMALQLQRQGERVALLASIDALAPAPFYADEVVTFVDDPTDYFVFLSKGFKYWFGEDVPLEREALVGLDLERQAARFMDLARKHGIYTPDAPDERANRVLDLGRRICRARYVPADRFTGTLAFFRGLDSLLCVTPTGGWEEVSTQPPRVRDLPGNHVTLVTEPYVDRLARELRAVIAEAQV
ncbi:non-ribosomal peptide synthetase [Pyxidicoccus fallax]|uniref:Non-ribosomal peptide synthetase n=1 Tax=Pyxidicoccus fallax TaxID=394095 RepID=A0A848LGG2_9BACT|nr:non-ribosomal peptide synthetase [Pyxidicoccus fallax]NMO15701.1 non-ribosomal peptide synthetase [Pyxidicoccus fallax]NPC77108.1 non-ribosomal peptide synthetase [Pyxidicoccus fallax]